MTLQDLDDTFMLISQEVNRVYHRLIEVQEAEDMIKDSIASLYKDMKAINLKLQEREEDEHTELFRQYVTNTKNESRNHNGRFLKNHQALYSEQYQTQSTHARTHARTHAHAHTHTHKHIHTHTRTHTTHTHTHLSLIHI